MLFPCSQVYFLPGVISLRFSSAEMFVCGILSRRGGDEEAESRSFTFQR